MNASHPNLTDSMSEINNKDCKKYYMERNKIKAQCAFIKLNNNRLIYKFKKCDDKSY